MCERCRAWIELPDHWGQVQVMTGSLVKGGYHVEQFRGGSLVYLWVAGGEVDSIPPPPAPPQWLREPALDRVVPGALLMDTVIDVDARVEVQMRDGSRVHARVTSQVRDRSGRWCVHLRWQASTVTGGREDWFVFDPAHIRRTGV
jgi:hypothetical protein